MSKFYLTLTLLVTFSSCIYTMALVTATCMVCKIGLFVKDDSGNDVDSKGFKLFKKLIGYNLINKILPRHF